jgi:RhtB (resistance to homoserine/threonine) family protein
MAFGHPVPCLRSASVETVMGQRVDDVARGGWKRRVTLDAVGAHLLVFVGVAAVVILLPGPDTAVVTKNVLLHGRRAGLGASAGVGAGLSVWTLAAAVGVASAVRASAVAFTVLKVAGALYLMWLGIQALRASRHASDDEQALPGVGRPVGARRGFRQGLLSDLANPKIGVFFTSLLPQFVDPGHPVLLPFMALGAVFVAMTVLWLAAYCLIAARAAETLRRPQIESALDRVTGVVLIAIGLRLVTEHR